MVNNNKFFMSHESDLEIQGVLIKNQVIVLEPNLQQQLRQKGYGEMDQGKLFLMSFESLYLLFTGRLALFSGKKNIDFDSLLKMCKEHDKDILTKFLVYRDLRNRGYTVRDGLDFGSDFRVYGKPFSPKSSAQFLVFSLNEGKHENISKLQKRVEKISEIDKQPIIAVVQRQGEIIYYKVSKIDFYQNKKKIVMQ